jgi:hypothetical protein
MIIPTRWNLLTVAGRGALVGALFSVGKLLIERPGAHWASLLGALVAGIVLGALLFGLATGIRNIFVRAR